MKYHLQPKDYAKARRFHYGIRSPLIQFFLILLFVLFASAILIMMREEFDILTLLLSAAVLIIFGNLAFGKFLWSRSARRSLRQMGKDQVDIEMEFDDAGIHFKDEESSCEFAWEKFIKWYGQENLVLLYRHSSLFLIVDLDQLPEERAVQLLEFLRKKIKGKSSKMKPRYRRQPAGV